jgi:excisionase family DNA binding protein
MMNSDPISVDIPTACRMSGISRSFLYEVLAAGQVRSVRAGRRRLVLVDSLRAWLQSLPTDGLAVSPTPAKGK